MIASMGCLLASCQDRVFSTALVDHSTLHQWGCTESCWHTAHCCALPGLCRSRAVELLEAPSRECCAVISRALQCWLVQVLTP